MKLKWAIAAAMKHLLEKGRINQAYFDSMKAAGLAFDGAYKTYEYFLRELERMIKNVYEGLLGNEFIDIMASLIYGQFEQAYQRAWADEGGEGELPDYLFQAFETAYLAQYDFVDQFYKDILEAGVDDTGLDPLLARAPLWANRYNENYDNAIRLITLENGGNLEWQLGATEEHCPECAALNGIVARAREWEGLNVRPQNAPNPLLSCGGWRCDCRLLPTDKRRSPNAFNTIMNIVTSKA